MKDLNIEVTQELLDQLKMVFTSRNTSMKLRKNAYLDYVAYFYQMYNRSFIGSNFCLYKATQKSPGCAIGQFMTEEDAIQADEIGSSISTLCRSSDKILLPDWMRDFDGNFLAELQTLHDLSYHWNEINDDGWRKNFITEKGMSRYSFIKENYIG